VIQFIDDIATTFSVEYISALTFKPQIIKSCGAFCDDANVSNLIDLKLYVPIWNICV